MASRAACRARFVVRREYGFGNTASVDGLTGMANRRRLDERLANAFDQGLVDGSPFAFVLVDVDYFKLHNDTYAQLACEGLDPGGYPQRCGFG